MTIAHVCLAALGTVALGGATAAAADPFPLKHGYYVSNVPCGKASFGTLSSYNGGVDFGLGHAECKMRILSQSGKTYRVRQECTSARDKTTTSQMAELTVESPSAYTVKNGYGTFKSRYCASNTLPHPWGTR